MGLLQEIRGMGNPNAGIIQAEANNRYSPIWLRVVARNGYYHIGFESLQEEKDACLRIEKRSFYGWLKENNLSIEEISKGNYKITNY